MDLKAPSIKVGEPVLHKVFRGGVVEPGALDPRQVDMLASTMAGRMRPPPPGVGQGPGPGPGPPLPTAKGGDVRPGFNGSGVGGTGGGSRGRQRSGRRGGSGGGGRGRRPGKF